MRSFLVFSQAMSRYIGLLIIALCSASCTTAEGNHSERTPLEQAGLQPVFRESFTDGNLQAMRYEPAYGSREQSNSYIQPGAIFLGQKDATENTEQQVNYYPKSEEQAIWTIEFDAWPTTLRESRVLVRPRRFRDGVHVRIGQPGERTEVVFRNEPGGYKTVDYLTPTGPRHGWAHVVVSYRADTEKKECEFVVAVNGEVHGRVGISYDPRPEETVRPFSIEYNGAGSENGYYLANVRGYTEFLDTEHMMRVLDGRVAAYLSALQNPIHVEGEWPQRVRVERTLINVTQKPADFDEKMLTVVPKSVVKVMRGPVVKGNVWVTHEMDVAKRNLVIKFGGGYRVVKVVYDSHGAGPAKALFQSSFKLALGYGGWGDQKLWNPIAIRGGLREGGLFTFYPNVPARYFKVYDTSTATAEGRSITDMWFVNVEGIRIYAVADPNLQRSGPNAYGEQTDDKGQFLKTAGLLD
ncbi:MAG: hypothetical protein ACYTAO_05490 [Planctomycetota bacterium]|jgi:hypothetical protein